MRQFTCSNVEQFECVIATVCKTLSGSQDCHEPIAFCLSHNLFYNLRVMNERRKWVVRQKYEGWLCAGFYF